MFSSYKRLDNQNIIIAKLYDEMIFGLLDYFKTQTRWSLLFLEIQNGSGLSKFMMAPLITMNWTWLSKHWLSWQQLKRLIYGLNWLPYQQINSKDIKALSSMYYKYLFKFLCTFWTNKKIKSCKTGLYI